MTNGSDKVEASPSSPPKIPSEEPDYLPCPLCLGKEPEGCTKCGGTGDIPNPVKLTDAGKEYVERMLKAGEKVAQASSTRIATSPALATPAVRVPGTEIVAASADDTLLDLTGTTTLGQLGRLGAWLAKAQGILPRGVDTPAKAMLVLKTLVELGLSYSALGEVMVSEGRVSVFGTLPRTLVERTGKVEWIREWYALLDPDGGEPKRWEVDGLPWFGVPLVEEKGERQDRWPLELRGVAEIKRTDRPDPIRRAFSVGQAKSMGLWGKRTNSGKPTIWATDPAIQILNRAHFRCAKAAFAEAFHGVDVDDGAESGTYGAPAPSEPWDAARPVDGGDVEVTF